MCQWCEKFGIDGDKWYLNPANFARRLYKVRRDEAPEGGTEGPTSGMGGAYMDEIIAARDVDPVALKEWIARGEEHDHTAHFAQVVTLDETMQVLDLAYPIARMTCGCRRAGRGLSDDDNFSCMGIGPGMYKWERWPSSYQGGVEFLRPDEAKEWLAFLDKRGVVHTVETFGTPYIGGMCQCTLPECGMIRMRVEYGKKIIFKGHYVAVVDYEKCNGCSVCVKRCQFTSMRMEPAADKAYVDQFKCYGCGLCATACAPRAIHMVERAKFPVLANEW